MQKSINSSIWNFQIRLRRIRNFPFLNYSFQSFFSSFNSVKSMGSSESRSDSPIGIASNSPPPAANHPLHHGQDYPYHQHSVIKLSWPKTLFAWREEGKSITPPRLRAFWADKTPLRTLNLTSFVAPGTRQIQGHHQVFCARGPGTLTRTTY